MPRLGGFPHARPFDSDALYETATSESGVVRTSLPPGPERDAIMTEIVEALQADAADVPAMVEELRGLMVGRDLTQLINSVAVPAMTVTFTGGESLADGDATSTWAAKIEYLVGVALSVDPGGDADTPAEVTKRVSQLISDIFEADQVRMFTESIENASATAAERELLLQQLQLEYQADRMPGYAVHLEQVDAEVFGRHRNYYVSGLGFDPADVIRATRLHTRSTSRMLSAALDGMADALNSGGPSPEAGEAMRRAFDAITLWKPEDVAASTGIAVEQASAMLEFFSTEYGCQPEFRVPGDSNRARTHPFIKLDDGTYLVPDPWSMSAIIHHRIAAEPKRNGFDSQKYFKHRQDAHERLVAGALEKVFGVSNVHSTQHYDPASGQHGEIDTLVASEWPLVVEAKAIALTESGRRGAPLRVDSKIETILGKALDQTHRALTYVLNEDGRTFAPTENGKSKQLLPDAVSGGTAIIATFERIDPFASGGLAVAGNVNRPTWVVSLTDLLMVTDILTDPAAFHHYARTRARMHTAQASAYAEADALGAYLLDRLRILDSAAVDTQLVIGYSCETLNNFYTRQEAGLPADKPTARVPDEVAGALANVMNEPGWVAGVDAVMVAELAVWKKWKNFRRKHRRGGTFTLNDQAALVVSTAAESSLERKGASLFINIPS
ncbi:hypothetical protein EUA04_14850 [Mycolicibacterium obuense]|uniref:Uncharacterized protein n=1 Tax=Mycolicibacterium obuense TaxID=1807 RepID=A0A4V3AYL8_9MYCO|nr:hypothetical protein [Mycolicibacterium obuense]TDL07227.1 hypothetical protein EUA04_14850 [Mycolicibacterium obuense]